MKKLKFVFLMSFTQLLAENSSVPVINALSSRYHPTQILADLLTLLEIEAGPDGALPKLSTLAGRKVAWVGDSNNILNDMLVTCPRLGINLSVAAPPGQAYAKDPVVWEQMEQDLASLPKRLPKGTVEWSHVPTQAVRDTDYIVTDTWCAMFFHTDSRISMGDEASKEQRLKDFDGFQVTEELGRTGGAKPHWKFLHCLPRKAEEVDDEVRVFMYLY